MTVHVGNMIFSDWVSLPFRAGWTDTFIVRTSALACIPPFYYNEPLRRMASYLRRKRPGASFWMQVDSPGSWFTAEFKRSLRGLQLPFAVAAAAEELGYLDFSIPMKLFQMPLQPPPAVNDEYQLVSQEELRCIQALGRMTKGSEDEIASLAGFPVDITRDFLANLEERRLVVHKVSARNQRNQAKPTPMDLFPVWHLKSKGLSLALRSWGVPKGIEFASRKEEHLSQIGYEHRHIARLWPAWLKSAWPHAEIWTGWSEVHVPGISVIPDGLAWGRVQGYETLFWLEVGDEHKSNDEIRSITTRRLEQARKLSERTGIRLVYAQLGANWVHDAARWSCAELSEDLAVILGNWRKFGELPTLEWGRATCAR